MGPSHVGHDHGATVGPDVPEALRQRQRKVLWWVLGLNGGFMVVEIVGGFLTNSLALLADGIHMASDVVGLAIALIAQSLLSRPASPRHTFGLQRAEVLGAQANGVILVLASAWISYEAIGRIGDTAEVEGTGLLIVASLGLAVNVASAVALARAKGDSLNMRGAFIHMLADAAGSVAAVGAGIAVITAGADWVDPAASLLISVLVVWSAWGLLRDTTHVLLEGTPGGLDRAEVDQAMTAVSGVEEIHHLHLWSLASDVAALSAHVVITGDRTLHDAQSVGDDIRAVLEDRFDIAHATLELECHLCEDRVSQVEVSDGDARIE